MNNYKKWGLALTALIISVIAYAHTDTTVTSRLKIPYPNLGFEGGTALHSNQSDMIEKIGDSINSRYEEFTAIADSTLVTHDHNFGVAFEELAVLIYTGTGANLIRVADPVGDGWVIAANGATPKLKVDVTTPSSGGPHTFTVIVIHGSGVESIDDLNDVDTTTTAPEDGQALVWDGSNFIPGASGDSSFKFQDITGTDLTIKAGYLILSDGREIRLAADLTYDLSGISSDGDYYFYIDLAGMPVAAVVGGRLVHSISATDIDTSESTPDIISKENFYPLGLAQRSGGTWSNPQTLAVRTHNNDRSITDWQAARGYYVDQLVISDNNLYKAKSGFISGGSFVESNWQLLSNNFGVPTRISISAPATPSIATLVNGKHYIVDMTNATQDVLVGLQEGADKTTIRVTLYNNPSSYSLNIDGFGAEKILYGETQYDDVDMGNILSWAQFVWDNTNSYWLVDDPSVFFAGTFNGDLNVTGALTVDTDTLVVDKVNNWVGILTDTPQSPLDLDVPDGKADDIYAARLLNNEATAGRNYGLYVSAGTNATDKTAQFSDKDGVELVTINGLGNVGIGTASPEASLEIKETDNPWIRLNDDGNNSGAIEQAGNDLIFSTSASLGSLIFKNSHSNASKPSLGGNTNMTIDSDGNVGIGAAPGVQYELDINKTAETAGGAATVRLLSKAGAGSSIMFSDVTNSQRIGHLTTTNQFQVQSAGTGGVVLPGGATAWAALSDRREKKNIKDLNLGLKEILKLQPISFDYLEDSSEDSYRLGFIAQDVQKLVEYAVTYEKDLDRYFMSIESLVPVMAKAIQELNSKNELMKAWICEQDNAPESLCN